MRRRSARTYANDRTLNDADAEAGDFDFIALRGSPYVDDGEEVDEQNEKDHQVITPEDAPRRGGSRRRQRQFASATEGVASLDKKPRQPLMKPLNITSVKMLEDLMRSPENVAIDFYKKDCPYCKTLAPIWNNIARQVHASNNNPGAVPIIIAKMDGVTHKEELDALRPGWSEGRGYPTILFKRVNPQDPSSIDAVEWDNQKPRTYDNLLEFMSEYYGDESLKPHSIDLINLMRNPQPEFTFMYSNATPVVLRFSKCLSDSPMLDIAEGNVVCASAFYRHPELARRGAALPVNELDRRDFPIPAIIDNRTGREHRYRDCQRWIQHEVERSAAASQQQPAHISVA